MDAARQMLNVAVQRGGAHDVALAFLTRIDRITAAAPATAAPLPVAASTRVLPAIAPARQFGAGLVIALTAVTAAAVLVYAVVAWTQVRAFIPSLNSPVESGSSPAAAARDPLVVPRSSDLALARAHELFAGGRLYDALRALDLVRPTDPLRGDADQLKVTIQRELIAHAPAPQ